MFLFENYVGCSGFESTQQIVFERVATLVGYTRLLHNTSSGRPTVRPFKLAFLSSTCEWLVQLTPLTPSFPIISQLTNDFFKYKTRTFLEHQDNNTLSRKILQNPYITWINHKKIHLSFKKKSNKTQFPVYKNRSRIFSGVIRDCERICWCWFWRVRIQK